MVGAFGGSWTGWFGLGAEDAAVDGRFAIADFRALRRFNLFGFFLYFGALKWRLKDWPMCRTQRKYLLPGAALLGAVFTQLPGIFQLLQLLLDVLAPLFGTPQVLIPQTILLKVFLLERHLSSED